MQSALETELERVVNQARLYLGARDRAVVLGGMLCCVPFLPITLVGIAVSLLNLLLVATHRLTKAEMPLLAASLGIGLIYCLGWWMLFRLVHPGAIIAMLDSFWHGWLPHAPSPHQPQSSI